MKSVFQKITIQLKAAVIGAAVGVVAGCLMGRAIVLHQTATRLEQYATKMAKAGDVSTAESRAVLATMNQSTAGFCSDAEIAQFRNLIYQAHQLKAAGRMQGGKVACSTTVGRVDSSTGYKPNFAQRDGTEIYIDLPPFRIIGKQVITVRKGDSFVVYNPFTDHTAVQGWVHFTVTDMDRVTRHAGSLYGKQPIANDLQLLTQGRTHVNGYVMATQCSAGGTVCMTAYTTDSEALAANRIEFAGFIAFGALTVSLFCVICSFLYRRNKGIEHQLLRAIRKDALQVVYQPIVDLATGQIVEAEALVRWTDEGNMAVPPDIFVKIAEERGFVGLITRLVVHRALHDFRQTLLDRPDFHINVNIAAPDLADPKFLPMLDQALAELGLSASSLGIEITESHTAREQIAKETIAQLRNNGHTVHIDDFGTGYSSLAYLHDLSVDAIKIDRAFIRAIGTEAVTVTILPQILAMARQLNLCVVVEGIETQEQADYFAHLDQEILAQGWLFGRPVPAEELRRRLVEEANSGRSVDEVFPGTAPAPAA
jgi:sensor c-di-GMP phosphodiesterase-like protein